MKEPRVAVLIPSYNHEKFLGAAVDSVLAQTRKPDRFIVVDDGSKDGSLDLLEARKRDGAPIEVFPQENEGAHAALNRGVREATEDCDVVAILNSDDVFAPRRIEECLRYLADHYDHAVVATGLTLIDDTGDPLDPESPRAKWFRAAWSLEKEPDLGLPEWIGTANFPATTSNIVARSRYLRANPFRSYRYGHDYFLLAKAALEDKLGLLGEPLVRYRIHGANTMNSSPGAIVREMLQLQLDLYREIGYDVMAQSELRERFQRYARASWHNISAFNAGYFQTILARLCSVAREDEVQEVMVVLGESGHPDLDEFPNKVLVNGFDGSEPLHSEKGLADKFQRLNAELRETKEDLKAWKELARARQQLLASRRTALGVVLGKCRAAAADKGKSGIEKLRNLKEAIAGDRWLNGELPKKK